MKLTPVDLVRERLKGLSERGVFRGWSETEGRGGQTVFRFRWLLDAEFTLMVDPLRSELVAKDLLVSVAYPSVFDRDLRRFAAGRSDPALPAHRRLDGEQVTLTYQNRRQAVSLRLKVQPGSFPYALKALLGTINDLFTYLNLYHIDYLQQYFGVPEE